MQRIRHRLYVQPVRMENHQERTNRADLFGTGHRHSSNLHYLLQGTRVLPGGCGRHTPDDVADIICDQQRAGLVDCDAHGTPPCLVVRADKAGEYIFGCTLWLSIPEGNENNLVAAARIAIPRPVLANESSTAILLTEQRGRVECQPQRGRMRAESIIGLDGPPTRSGRGGLARASTC